VNSSYVVARRTAVRRSPTRSRSGNLARVEVVRWGRCLYDNAVEKPVDIVSFDFDWWYELGKADGALEPDEEPQPVGPDGVLYYVRFTHAGQAATPTWVDSGGHATMIANAADESEIERRLADDSWAIMKRLVTVAVEPWLLVVGSERL
jgi:hypothetical protein